MSGYIKRILMKVPCTNKMVDIKVCGKTLILTGGNGSGKTQLLQRIHDKLKESIVDRNNLVLTQIERDLESNKRMLEKTSPAHPHYPIYQKQVEDFTSRLKNLQNPSLEISNIEKYVVDYHDLKAILCSFEAMRKSEILKPTSVSSMSSLRYQEKQTFEQKKTQSNSSTLFEQFLVTSKANQAFSESKRINDDPAEAHRIDKWFTKLESDLRSLFEDQKLQLVFKSDSFTFEIQQEHKTPYTFQTLSSGFSSIMAIYADLITKLSLRSIDPEDLTGVVLIDEIDAHLHVSLQKKVLHFFTQAFPKVQFIVTTHSPFVVSSVNDAVIYDLSKLEQVDDLSMYSYEAVLEGLFGVLPISSLLQKNIETLAKLLERPKSNFPEIERLLNQLPSDEDSLDPESLYFVNSAKLALSKAKR
ncbi:AAA family ATPase [Marinomonas gallaica]|uniref:AAA family ATPase n=1 Tax=Marinomonas gallaica TaxID=1806667 RepID=UPI00082E7041|nr:AAA family ATPase [Marinomonas gallaica]